MSGLRVSVSKPRKTLQVMFCRCEPPRAYHAPTACVNFAVCLVCHTLDEAKSKARRYLGGLS